jgi:hypothetical protein
MAGYDTYIPLNDSAGRLVAVIMTTTVSMDITGYGGESPANTIRENAGNIASRSESVLVR